MKWTKSIDHSLCFLVLGLMVLLSSGLFSIFATFKLEDSYVQKMRSKQLQDSYSLLAKQVRDWAIHSNYSNSFETFRYSRDALILEENIEATTHKIIHFPRLVAAAPSDDLLISDISDLVRFKNSNVFALIKKIDLKLNRMVQLEEEWVTKFGDEMILYINHLMAASKVSLFIAIVLIIYSFFLKRRDDVAKGKLIVTLDELRAKAEVTSQEKSNFLSTVSHEIRTPLNGIIGISDVLSQSSHSAQELMLIKTINQSGRTLLRIINDVLDFSKVNAGKVELIEKDVLIEDILRFVFLNLSVKADEKSLLLKGEIYAGVPQKVRIDSERFTQVLFNIIGNAIKFSEQGTILVKVQLQKKMMDKVILQVSVSDEGIGIDEKDIKKLFQPFVQISREGTSGEVGTGLGLSISRGIISVMGGDINVISKPGKGSTFYFDLKISNFGPDIFETNLSISSSAEASTHLDVAPAKKNYKPNILIVDDNSTNQIVAQSMLRRSGFSTLLADNGAEALKVFKSHDIDLILMDCHMPVLDGFSATEQIRLMGSKVPIIAITANAFSTDRNVCFNAGMDDFIAKPVEMTVLNDKISKLLPSERTLSIARLFKLDSDIGIENRKKVVSAFHSSTRTFKETFKESLDSSDLKGLNQLGHRYKGAAWTVGGIAFGQKCLKLENCRSLVAARKLESELMSSLLVLEESLRDVS